MLASYHLSSSDRYDSSSVLDPTTDYTNSDLFEHTDNGKDSDDQILQVVADPFDAFFDTINNDSTAPGGQQRISPVSATASSPWRTLVGDLLEVFSFFAMTAMGMLVVLSMIVVVAHLSQARLRHMKQTSVGAPIFTTTNDVDTAAVGEVISGTAVWFQRLVRPR